MVIPGNVLLYHSLAFLQRITLLPTTLCFLEIISDSCVETKRKYGTYSNLTHLIPTPQFCLLNWPVSPDLSNIPTVGVTHVTQLSEQETKELSRYERGVVGLNPDLRLPTKSARSDGSSHLLRQAPLTAFPVIFSPFSPLCLQSPG